jgi:hypothetical protein
MTAVRFLNMIAANGATSFRQRDISSTRPIANPKIRFLNEGKGARETDR